MFLSCLVPKCPEFIVLRVLDHVFILFSSKCPGFLVLRVPDHVLILFSSQVP